MWGGRIRTSPSHMGRLLTSSTLASRWRKPHVSIASNAVYCPYVHGLYCSGLCPRRTVSFLRSCLIHINTVGDVPPSKTRHIPWPLIIFNFIFFISLIISIVDGPHSILPILWSLSQSLRIFSSLSPVHASRFFIATQVRHSYNSSTKG